MTRGRRKKQHTYNQIKTESIKTTRNKVSSH